MSKYLVRCSGELLARPGGPGDVADAVDGDKEATREWGLCFNHHVKRVEVFRRQRLFLPLCFEQVGLGIEVDRPVDLLTGDAERRAGLKTSQLEEGVEKFLKMEAGSLAVGSTPGARETPPAARPILLRALP